LWGSGDRDAHRGREGVFVLMETTTLEECGGDKGKPYTITQFPGEHLIRGRHTIRQQDKIGQNLEFIREGGNAARSSFHQQPAWEHQLAGNGNRRKSLNWEGTERGCKENQRKNWILGGNRHDVTKKKVWGRAGRHDQWQKTT